MIRWILIQILLVVKRFETKEMNEQEMWLHHKKDLYEMIFPEAKLLVLCWCDLLNKLHIEEFTDHIPIYKVLDRMDDYKRLVKEYTLITVNFELFRQISITKSFPKEFNIKLI